MAQPIIALAQTAPGQALERLTLAAPEAPTGYEVDLEIHHCSVCHSDVHLVDGDWGEVKKPLIPGHEIVGRVLRQGPQSHHQVGAMVGVGWQAGACGACAACVSGREHLCTGGKVRTCVGRQGGFATELRVDARFAFALPEGLDLGTAAPLLCAGLTVFSPLERFKVGPGRRVGVVGVGGLGHMAVQFAKALGAEVIGFDPDLSKRELALKLGARELVSATGPLPSNAVDLLLVTTHANLDWTAWMNTLTLEGTMCLIGVPSKPLTVSVDPLMDEQKTVTGSVIGSPASMRAMLSLAAAHKLAPITERMPMSQANAALQRVREGAARLRVVLDRDLG